MFISRSREPGNEAISTSSFVPRVSQNANMYRWESLVSFFHDVIQMVLKQKGNILCVVQPTMHSTLGVYDIQPVITRYM